jgi:hypothetical protein
MAVLKKIVKMMFPDPPKQPTAEEIRQDIQDMITEGYNNPDPEVRANWVRMCGSEEIPTVEDALLYIKARADAEQAQAVKKQEVQARQQMNAMKQA